MSFQVTQVEFRQKSSENLILEFLPITADQIKKWAVFDSEHQTYDWERLGCLNYSPLNFGTSLPGGR